MIPKQTRNPAMSLPEYVGRRNSTTLVGSPPFGYACTDDRAGDACAYWHPPGVTPREMGYHETPYAKLAPRERRTASPVPQSRHYSSESMDTARHFSIAHKRGFPFVGHFSGILDVSRLTIEELLQGSGADKDAITLMTAGSEPPIGGFVACILDHTELMF
jgi:hypothetical protein